ncbi:MAG: M48 family metalloprotease [Bacteroidetes bacterium]|nr:M48 family metalloprotease [Bacteroidota bacterium]
MKSFRPFQTAGRLSRRAWLYLSASILAGLAACGLNIYSVDQDASLGKQMDQEIRSTPSQYPILNNESVRGYVQGVVNKIIQSPAIKYRGKFPYTVTIINDDKTVNAFCTPGGYIYVYTGLLKFIDNEATLAGVVGHEIAHAEERHGTKHMTQALGADIALQIALGNNPGQLAQIAGNATVLLATLRNSRSDEMDADTKSFEYLRSTPYYPGSIQFFFKKMVDAQGNRTPSKLEEWTSTHPTSQERYDNINSLLKSSNTPPPTAANLFADNYRNMLSRLR